MSQLNGESFNIEENNIEKLVQLFPEVQTDGKIDFDKLKQILGDYVDDSEERYRFVWNGKGEALRLSQTPSMGTLRPAKEESNKIGRASCRERMTSEKGAAIVKVQ